MLPLHPVPEVSHQCAHCQTPLEILGWHIPGMRNLADLRCPSCGREFYGDLPAGQALYTPMLLEKETGTVHDFYGVKWFADWLRDSYLLRSSSSAHPSFRVKEFLPIQRPVVLLNCLDTVYGHALLKLLNAQRYLNLPAGVDLVLIIQPFLEWMIPSGVAQAWVIDLPLHKGAEWNDGLAQEIHRRVEEFGEVSLSYAFSHPHPNDFKIECFTHCAPFPLDEWTARLARPTVSFIWREDRCWDKRVDSHINRLESVTQRIKTRAHSLRAQRKRVSKLADALRGEWPELDFAVTGLGEPGGLPAWVSDMRRSAVTPDTERAWCERYAASHLVVGVHGSNMLLPSAHAGAVVELLATKRRSNFLQDILFRYGDPREMFFRYQFVPDSIEPLPLAQLLILILRGYPDFRRMMSAEFSGHGVDYESLKMGTTIKRPIEL